MENLATSMLIDRAFAKYDADNSGQIDKAELGALAEDLGDPFGTDAELAEALDLLDTDDSGKIDKKEFTDWWISRKITGASSAAQQKLAQLAAKGKNKFYVDIHMAAWNGEVSEVKQFLALDVGLVNNKDTTDFGESNTPLHYAAYQGHTEVIQALLDAGAEVNATNEAGCTPLFFAAQQEREDVVALLLEAGAEVAVPEKKHGLTAFDVTNEAIQELFKSKGVFSRVTITAPPAPVLGKASLGRIRVTWEPPEKPMDYGSIYLPPTKYVVQLLEVAPPGEEKNDESGEGGPSEGTVTTTGSGDVAAEIAELADITEFSVVDILAEQTVGSDTLEADVAGLEPGTLVTARVLAECSGGRSEWSMAGAPVRVAKVPSRPKDFVAQVLPSHAPVASAGSEEFQDLRSGKGMAVKFSWRCGGARGLAVTGYRILGRQDEGSKWRLLAKIDSQYTSAVLDGFLAKASWFFTVVALSQFGRSRASDQQSITMPHMELTAKPSTAASRGRKSSRSSASQRQGPASPAAAKETGDLEDGKEALEEEGNAEDTGSGGQPEPEDPGDVSAEVMTHIKLGTSLPKG